MKAGLYRIALTAFFGLLLGLSLSTGHTAYQKQSSAIEVEHLLSVSDVIERIQIPLTLYSVVDLISLSHLDVNEKPKVLQESHPPHFLHVPVYLDDQVLII